MGPPKCFLSKMERKLSGDDFFFFFLNEGKRNENKEKCTLLTLIKRNVDLYLLSVQFSTTIKRKISDSLFLKVKRRSI